MLELLLRRLRRRKVFGKVVTSLNQLVERIYVKERSISIDRL